MTTDILTRFIADEQNPAIKPSCEEQLQAAFMRMGTFSYAHGLLAGLSKLELIASIVPNEHGSLPSGREIIEMAKRHLQTALTEWKERDINL